MRRSLLIRLLALSLAVAACAIGATAWLTGQATSEQLQGELERTLEGDAAIYQELLGFADGQPTWDGVEKLVDQLAGRTGQRIALTALDGHVLADSAGPGPDRPRLPRTPAAVVDPFSPALNLLPAGTAASAASGKLVGDGLSAKEHDERAALARKAAGCFIRSGFPARVTDDPLNSPNVVWDTAPNAVIVSCIPAELTRPTDKELAITSAVKQLSAECFDAARQSGDVSTAAMSDCQAKADRAVRDPYVADPALLYLGTGPDRYQASFDPHDARTLGTVLAVLLATVAVTLLAGRRLARPIHALTAAVQRMEAGDRSARVPVRGRRQDEVGRLSQAFNAMAVSMEENERQRQAMVSDIAHELRNPLTNVRGYLEGVQDGLVPLDESLVASLLEEATLLGRLVDDLQDLALADAGRLHLHPEPLDAVDLVEQVTAAHRAAAAVAGVTVTANVRPPVPVEGDPGRLRQALGNLVGNALRYTPSGGQVTVSAFAADGQATISVGDTGAGIAPEHLPHIFDRFYRADPSRSRETGGSGLGLAITRHIVEAHAGTIEVRSTEGVGSTFTIRLPMTGGGRGYTVSDGKLNV